MTLWCMFPLLCPEHIALYCTLVQNPSRACSLSACLVSSTLVQAPSSLPGAQHTANFRCTTHDTLEYVPSFLPAAYITMKVSLTLLCKMPGASSILVQVQLLCKFNSGASSILVQVKFW